MLTYPTQSGTWTWTLSGDGAGLHPPADALAALQGLVMAEYHATGVTVVDWFLESPENRRDGTEQTAVMTVTRGGRAETLRGSLRLTLTPTATGGRIDWSFQAIGTNATSVAAGLHSGREVVSETMVNSPGAGWKDSPRHDSRDSAGCDSGSN